MLPRFLSRWLPALSSNKVGGVGSGVARAMERSASSGEADRVDFSADAAAHIDIFELYEGSRWLRFLSLKIPKGCIQRELAESVYALAQEQLQSASFHPPRNERLLELDRKFQPLLQQLHASAEQIRAQGQTYQSTPENTALCSAAWALARTMTTARFGLWDDDVSPPLRSLGQRQVAPLFQAQFELKLWVLKITDLPKEVAHGLSPEEACTDGGARLMARGRLACELYLSHSALLTELAKLPRDSVSQPLARRVCELSGQQLRSGIIDHERAQRLLDACRELRQRLLDGPILPTQQMSTATRRLSLQERLDLLSVKTLLSTLAITAATEDRSGYAQDWRRALHAVYLELSRLMRTRHGRVSPDSEGEVSQEPVGYFSRTHSKTQAEQISELLELSTNYQLLPPSDRTRVRFVLGALVLIAIGPDGACRACDLIDFADENELPDPRYPAYDRPGVAPMQVIYVACSGRRRELGYAAEPLGYAVFHRDHGG